MNYEELKNLENPAERAQEENTSSLDPSNPRPLEPLRLIA